MKKLNNTELDFIVRTLKFLNPYDPHIDKIKNKQILSENETECVKHTLFGRDLYGPGLINDHECDIYAEICEKLCHDKTHIIC